MDLSHYRWQRNVTPSGTAGGKLMDPQRMAQPTEALRILGDVASREGMEHAYRLDGMIKDNQLTQFQLAAEKAFDDMELGDDPLQFNDKYAETLGKIRTDHLGGITHEQARQEADTWLSGREIDWGKAVRQRADQLTIRQANELFKAKREFLMKTGDEKGLAELYGKRFEQFSHKEGMNDLPENWPNNGEIKDALDYQLANDLMDLSAGRYEGAKDAALAAAKGVFHQTGSVTDAIRTIQANPSIRETDKDGLFEDIRTYSAAMKAAGDEAKYRQKETFKKDLNQLKFSDNPQDLTTAFERVRKNDGDILTADEQEKELDDIKNRIKAAGATFADVTDDAAYMAVSGDLTRFKQGTVTRDAFYKTLLANKGKLTESDYNRMKQSLEDAPGGTDPLKKTAVTEALSDLDRLSSGYYFAAGGELPDKDDKAELEGDLKTRMSNMRIYTAIHKEFTDWVKQNPQATDGQIQEKYQGLVEPAVEKTLLPGWTAFTPASGFYWMSRWLGPKKTTKADAWNTLADRQNVNTASATATLEQIAASEPNGQYVGDDEYQVGQTMTRGGVTYTYVGNGEWEN